MYSRVRGAYMRIWNMADAVKIDRMWIGLGRFDNGLAQRMNTSYIVSQ
jgi:hypothetical protein